MIGGVALILAVAFGIWFMRSYKRKHAIQPGAEPYRMAESIGYQPGYPDQPPPGQEYYGGYQPGNAWGYALPAEQKPDQQVPLAEMPPDNNRRPGPTAELQ